MAVIYPVDRRAWDEFAANEMGWEYGCGRHQFGYDWTGKYRGFSDRERLLTLSPNLEAALDADLAAREASGMTINKCDFMDGDSQDRMRDYDAIAKISAKHKIMLNWHGAALPRGQRRRRPNLVGYEGVLGAEYYIWSQGPTLIHRLCLPFIRNVVGPMDFTGVELSTIDAKRQNTDAAELSEAVLYENGFSYWGDAPEIYRSIPAAMSFLSGRLCACHHRNSYATTCPLQCYCPSQRGLPLRWYSNAYFGLGGLLPHALDKLSNQLLAKRHPFKLLRQVQSPVQRPLRPAA